MSHDPFDVLATQLRQAVRRRPRRRGPSRRGLLALAAALVVGGGVAAASGVLTRETQSAADRAIAAAQRWALKQPACSARRSGTRSRLVAGPAPDVLLKHFALFRHGRSVVGRVSQAHMRVGGRIVLKETVRLAQASDGTQFLLFASFGDFNSPAGYLDPVGCAQATLAAGLSQPEAKDPSVRREIARRLGARVRGLEGLRAGRQHILSMNELWPGGRFAGGMATVVDKRVPAMASIGPTRRGPNRFVVLTGLIPDGVHDVRIVDRVGPAGLRVKPIVVRVHDNVFHAKVPRRVGPKITVQWRAPDGSVLRTTHLSY